MAGGGKKRYFKNGKSKPYRASRSSSSGSLFVEGGALAGFDSPSFSMPASSPPGKNSNSKSNSASKAGSRTRNLDRAYGSAGLRKPGVNSFRYDYPSTDSQGRLQRGSVLHYRNADSPSFQSESIVLLDTKDSKGVVYEHELPSKGGDRVEYNYHYGSGFELGDSTHCGLGLSEPEATPGSDGLSLGEMKDERACRGLGYLTETDAALRPVELSTQAMKEDQPHTGLGFFKNKGSDDMRTEDEGYCFLSDEELDRSTSNVDEEEARMVQEILNEHHSAGKNSNSGFLSIGGMKLYTEDISDGESDDEDNEDSSEEGSSSEELSDSDDDSDDSFESGCDIDDEAVDDYIEGVGGSGEILNAKWLGKLNMDASLDKKVDDVSDEDDKVVKKLSGIALQDASRQYGVLKNPKSNYKNSTKSKSPVGSTMMWSSALDDLMLVKDPRRLSKKKKHVAENLPGSWPSRNKKSKNFRSYPGEKKKHRKEMLAAKKRQRMMNRGVDLDQINSKLKNMVLQNVDILSFHPMHSRDCSQVQKLASIYRLRSGCTGSGKKRFVTVTRTQHTSMPSASDAVRLEKLLGVGKEDADFSVTDTPKFSGYSARSFKNSASQPEKSKKKYSSGKKGTPSAFANQPVAFVSSGVIQSDPQDSTVVRNSSPTGDSSTPCNNDSAKSSSAAAKFGAFEYHTKGFGSKMMAKMGYIEGEGLGKDGNGMSEPIEVTKRPKSLGLGHEFSETADGSEKKVFAGAVPVDRRRSGSGRKEPPSFGEFERHTKGFGSKMMAKMGFVEGSGLGRDSQGMVNPIVAVRRPKARGLGAEQH